MMRRQERSGSVETGLDFIEHKKRAILFAQRLCGAKIVGWRYAHSGFRLNWFDHKGREFLCSQLGF
jgi:hypothetical protein